MDNILKVSTFKSGNFVFSRNYDQSKFKDDLTHAKYLWLTIVDIPILPEIAAKLKKDIIRKSIFSTAAIEGNPLTQEQVNQILDEEIQVKSLEKTKREIQNLELAYKFIEKIKPAQGIYDLSEETIKSLHKLITDGCIDPEDGIPGNYRNRVVKVGDDQHGGVYTPPKCLDDIRNLMDTFIKWINDEDMKKEDFMIRAALSHFYIALIHPFVDGNGRTARAIEALMLKSAGMKYLAPMLTNFYYKNLDEYYWAFSRSEKNDSSDITPFIEFYLKGLVTSLEEAKKFIFNMIREFTLQDYYRFLRRTKVITQRQLDFLVMLLDENIPFKFSDLYENEKFRIVFRKISERTARRDLERLKSQRILLLDEERGYKLNLNVLSDEE